MSERVLFALAAGVIDLYLLWTLLRAIELGVVSTKWGKIFRDQAPTRFWITWGFQMVLAVILFPALILRFFRAG
jgi:hypothetical protein